MKDWKHPTDVRSATSLKILMKFKPAFRFNRKLKNGWRLLSSRKASYTRIVFLLWHFVEMLFLAAAHKLSAHTQKLDGYRVRLACIIKKVFFTDVWGSKWKAWNKMGTNCLAWLFFSCRLLCSSPRRSEFYVPLSRIYLSSSSSQ